MTYWDQGQDGCLGSHDLKKFSPSSSGLCCKLVRSESLVPGCVLCDDSVCMHTSLTSSDGVRTFLTSLLTGASRAKCKTKTISSSEDNKQLSLRQL